MDKYDIFFSWQSDIKINRNLIEKALRKGYCKCKDIGVFNIISDARDKTGAPDIAQELFDKIALSNIFVADLTIVNKSIISRMLNVRTTKRYTPNPNVMLETGYAYHVLGDEKVLLLYNSDYCKAEELPFDINHKRVIEFNKNNINRVTEGIEKTIRSLNNNNKLYNSYIDEKLRRPEFDVRFNKGTMEDDDNEEYFNHIKLLNIDETGNIKITVNNNINLESIEKYKKIDYDEQAKSLGVSQFEIDNYNEKLPAKEEIEGYIEEYNLYQQKCYNGIPIEFVIRNIGNRKASDVLINIRCNDDSIFFFKTEDCQFAEEPKRLKMPENPINIAIDKRLGLRIFDCFNSMSWYGNKLDLSPSVTRALMRTNKCYEFRIKNNIIVAKYEKGILHEDERIIKGISLVPMKKGISELIITIKCEENVKEVVFKKRVDIL